MAGLKLHRAGLVGDQRWTRPLIVLALRQQMPAEHSELAGHGHRCDLMAAPGANAPMQRTRCLGRCPGRFDQHGAGVTAPDLADATMIGGSQSRLPHSRVQPEIADQLTAPRVFLSYARVDADKKFVRELHQRLRRDGIECFFDEVSLAPGANFVLQVSVAIDECNYLVMVMSRAYFSARFAPVEWAAVLADDPKNERGRLVPLLLEECELPALIKQLNYIDVSSTERFRTELSTHLATGRSA